MKMDGSQHPADAVRKEIEKMRSSMTTQEESTETSTPTEIESSQEDNVEQSDSFQDTIVDSSFGESEQGQSVDNTPREQTVDYWKHRFDVIQGKYHAETTELRNQVTSLKNSIDDLVSRQETNISFAGSSVEKALDNLEEEYGEDFSKALNQRIQSLVDSRLQYVTNKVDQEISTVRQVQAQNEEQLFQDSIAKFIPNWVNINTDPAFIGWLENNVETFSGYNFMHILRSAYTNRDLDKVTKIFSTYIEAVNKHKQRQPSTEQNSMISPPRRGSVANNVIDNATDKVYTQAEIQEFYSKLNNGAFKGKDDYVRQTKLAILQANADGRII